MYKEKLEALFAEIDSTEIDEIFEAAQIEDENMKENIKNVIFYSSYGDKINNADALKSILEFVSEGAYYYVKDTYSKSILHESSYKELEERLELAISKGIGVCESFDNVYCDESDLNDKYLTGDYSTDDCPDDSYSDENYSESNHI